MKGVLWADPSLSTSVPAPSRPVIFHRGNRLWEGSGIATKYGEDVLRFRYSSPGGNMVYPVRYQTRLSGRDEVWSAPTALSSRELGQVWEGRYAFEVRAVDPFGRVSPWRPSTCGYIRRGFGPSSPGLLYGVILVFLVWLIFLIQGRKLRRRQALLEEEVRTRTFELERANRFKDDFIANLSHEIRNPLNGVIGSIRQLRPEVALPERTLKSLRGAAHYLQTTVEEVLDFAKLESGEISVETVAFDINEMVSGIVEIHQPAAHAKGLNLTTRLQIPEGMAVVSDARKVQQIIGNLVGNAVKFTDSGSVTLGIKIQPDGERGGSLRIWVKDSGPGIPVPEQERIFDKFYQGKQGSSKTAGTGIGLALVRTFIDRLGGQLELQSEPGTGSTFIVNLRIGLQPLEVSAASQTASRKYKGVRVLIVEDLEYNRTVLEDFSRKLDA
jgi:signal transduction histidine kinase